MTISSDNNRDRSQSPNADDLDDTPAVVVPPIRSLTIRNQPHNNSTLTLKGDGKGGGVSSLSERAKTTSTNINKAIRELEKLFNEAVRIADLVSVDQTKSEKTEPPTSPKRRPSEALTTRAMEYLQSQNRNPSPKPLERPHLPKSVRFPSPGPVSGNKCDEHDHGIKACGPAHGNLDGGLKSSPVTAKVTSPDEIFELGPVVRRSTKKSASLDDFKVLPPEPIVEPLNKSYSGLEINRRSSEGSKSRKDGRNRLRKVLRPPISPRTTSIKFRAAKSKLSSNLKLNNESKDEEIKDPEVDFEEIDLTDKPRPGHERHFTTIFGVTSRQHSIDLAHPTQTYTQKINLRRQRHVDVPRVSDDFDVHQTCNHAPVARDWPNSRKRFTAAISCINLACIGIMIGIYSGQVPAIQYIIVDLDHYTILGNVFLYCGLAIPSFVLWPLPLLHGRKPYTVIGLSLALCLQIPQGLATSSISSPYVQTYRVLLLLSRAISGFALGLVDINVHATLLDLFGASLRSDTLSSDVVNPDDARQHGGGMGLWLGTWSWCTIGPISIGFLFGTFIINGISVSWGFWTSLLLLMFVLLLNVISPEPRRSAFRRTLAEITEEGGDFSRVARGEVKMHLESVGPYWWGEEIKAGLEMCWLMIQQPGFLVLSVYAAWVYAQFTMILMLLGALTSRYYRFRPIAVGLCVLSLGLGSFCALPFQKASCFSRSRYRPPRTNTMTLHKALTWSSHLVRRTIFTFLLPLAAWGYAFSSWGKPVPIAIPCLMTAAVGYLSTLAMTESYSIIMETFDTSDLQIGMTGRPFRKSPTTSNQLGRTNFSCYPRISAGFAVIQTFKFLLAASATGVCGRLERQVGAMEASAIVAGILLILTLLMTLVLYRWKTVQLLPGPPPTPNGMKRKATDWEPWILGQPTGTTRCISVLEAGRYTRWSEIRKRNRINSETSG